MNRGADIGLTRWIAISFVLAAIGLVVSERGGKDGIRFGMSGGVEEKIAPRVTKTERESQRDHSSAREDFVKKSKEGMSEKEVRWILDDLANMEIDSSELRMGDWDDFAKIRKSRDRWYFTILAETLHFTPEQKLTAEKRMGELYQEDFKAFSDTLNGLKTFEHEGQTIVIVNGSQIRDFTDGYSFLESDAYQPWNLCELSEDQTAITSKHDLQPGATKVPPQRRDLGKFSNAGTLFPFSSQQIESMLGNETDLPMRNIEMVRRLHPAQFKMLLLLDPDFSKTILKELDEGNE